uniref:NADH-ubiquinone oxidoreductase chain 5 n=1 Tax=Succinea putris TaxID=145427 RepID=G8HSG4_9EUPU|nr:NADH dehydrogenase subunit 5 [Succinea putris]AEQ93925.1 NADH dehydrogenase subunit 5 [Succinea putris]
MIFKSFNRLTMLLGLFVFIISMFFMYFCYKLNIYILEFQLGSLWSINLSLSLIFDWISLSFSFVVLIISFAVFWFASMYMKEDLYFHRFIWLLFSFVLSMLVLIFSGSFLSILIGWDGLGVTSFLLIIYYPSHESLKSGYLTLLINRIGDILIIISLIYLIYNSMLNFYLFKPLSTYYVMFLMLICLAALTKSAQYPFSSWLPAAMAAPTPVSALVHSSTLVTAGIYLVIRVSENIEMNSWNLSMFLFVGSMTTLLGSLSALNEYDLKKIIALSTLSQLGIMVFCLGLNNIYLSFFHLFTHAMFKALLFMVAGWILMMSYGVQDMRSLGNILCFQPFMMTIFFSSVLALMGIPFLSAYYSKHLIFELMFNSTLNFLSFFILILSSMITCVYSLRMMKMLSFFGLNNLMTNINSNMISKLPYFLLSFMSIFSGKIFNNLIMNFKNSYFLLNYNLIILFFILIIGLVLGMYFKYSNIYMFSTMLFLVPFSFFFKKVMFNVSKTQKMLDYGILEPSNILSEAFFKMSNFLSFFIIWPKSSNFIWARLMIIVCSLFIFWWLMY